MAAGPAVAQSADREEGPSGEDTLSLYLQEMGAHPLFSPAQEREVVQRLERVRGRYRRAVLFNGAVLDRVIDTFERVQKGEVSLDRTIDVVPSLDLTAEHIRARIPGHLRLLRKLREKAASAFEQSLRAGKRGERVRLLRQRRAILRRAIVLVEKLSPRVELIDEWAEELRRRADRLDERTRADDAGGREELRAALLEAQATPEELRRLVHVQQRRQAVYLETRRELAQANLRLVVSIAKRYRNRGIAFADLIQEGNGGLMRAVDKFDHRLGYRFGTYATWWIRQSMTRALADLSRTVRVPSHLAGLLATIDRVRGELMVRLEREPTAEEVADAAGTRPEDVRLLGRVGRNPASLDALLQDEEDSFRCLLGDTSTSPGDAADQLLLKERVAEVLASLAPRDREVIELRFGLRDGRPHSLDEVARSYGITRERVRQIESRGLEKLRQPERRKRLADFAGVG